MNSSAAARCQCVTKHDLHDSRSASKFPLGVSVVRGVGLGTHCSHRIPQRRRCRMPRLRLYHHQVSNPCLQIIFPCSILVSSITQRSSRHTANIEWPHRLRYTVVSTLRSSHLCAAIELTDGRRKLLAEETRHRELPLRVYVVGRGRGNLLLE